MYDSLCTARGSEGIIVYTLTGATLSTDREHATRALSIPYTMHLLTCHPTFHGVIA